MRPPATGKQPINATPQRSRSRPQCDRLLDRVYICRNFIDRLREVPEIWRPDEDTGLDNTKSFNTFEVEWAQGWRWRGDELWWETTRVCQMCLQLVCYIWLSLLQKCIYAETSDPYSIYLANTMFMSVSDSFSDRFNESRAMEDCYSYRNI